MDFTWKWKKLVLIKKSAGDYFQGYSDYISTVKEPFVAVDKKQF